MLLLLFPKLQSNDSDKCRSQYHTRFCFSSVSFARSIIHYTIYSRIFASVAMCMCVLAEYLLRIKLEGIVHILRLPRLLVFYTRQHHDRLNCRDRFWDQDERSHSTPPKDYSLFAVTTSAWLALAIES